MYADFFNIFAQYLIAFGTLSVVVIAVWGDSIRKKIYTPKLKIIPYNTTGTLTKYQSGERVIFYHLKVINIRKGFSVKDCRVLLKQIQKKGPDGRFYALPFTIPHQFIWAPALFTPTTISINKEQELDFGSIVENQDFWKPELYWRANNFQGDVRKNEVLRYCLEIDAEGLPENQYQVFEVAWNGIWSDNTEEMKRNLIIREVDREE